MSEKIAFDVETSRILEILSSEIYDSPKAFLRENVQNAYDAVLMRCTAAGLSLTDRSIEISVEGRELRVRDDGIGMTEEVLRSNFWKAGSSGKKSALARESGVIGTFGIGAMANFGVCTRLRVETRHFESADTLVSTAVRDELQIAKECVTLERIEDERGPGTLIVAELDQGFSLSVDEACGYLAPYVQFLKVPVRVNDKLISCESYEEALGARSDGFETVASRRVVGGGYAGNLRIGVNTQRRVLAELDDISLNGTSIDGDLFLVQGNAQTLGFRNLFGLAPIPIPGHYGLGGFVNLSILQPTAGREAVSRDGIRQVGEMVALIEKELSETIADTDLADVNQQFQQYILAHGRTELAKNVTISVLPERESIALGRLTEYAEGKQLRHYAGRDSEVMGRFANDQSVLAHVSQGNPRRKLQLRYLSQVAHIDSIPDEVIVDRVAATELTLEEAMFLVQLRGVLLDDYLIGDVDAGFAVISHGVAFDVKDAGGALTVSIARDVPAVRTVIECYTTARDVFEGFMKDFVREHLYPLIRDHVPSSRRQGRDALYERLRRNKDLIRLREEDYGPIEALLSDYLAGKADLEEVLRTSRGRASGQRQTVTVRQVGKGEEEIAGIIEAPSIPSEQQNKWEPAPPIVREDIDSRMKVLMVEHAHSKLNNFQMFLALSDRMVKLEGEFLRWPHTTKLIWGAHRIIYIFGDESGELSLYYDVELKTPLDVDLTGGSMFQTTTIITKKRIFVPVPRLLEPAFEISEGGREFYVRFDTIP